MNINNTFMWTGATSVIRFENIDRILLNGQKDMLTGTYASGSSTNTSQSLIVGIDLEVPCTPENGHIKTD